MRLPTWPAYRHVLHVSHDPHAMLGPAGQKRGRPPAPCVEVCPVAVMTFQASGERTVCWSRNALVGVLDPGRRSHLVSIRGTFIQSQVASGRAQMRTEEACDPQWPALLNAWWPAYSTAVGREVMRSPTRVELGAILQLMNRQQLCPLRPEPSSPALVGSL